MEMVLIADDDRILTARLVTMMGKYEDKFDVIAVSNGKEAVSVLRRRKISLLITDIQMPEMDGLELLAYINEHHPVIPCFVMTAYGTPELRKKLPKDVIRYFSKPVDAHAISKSVVDTLERKIPRGSIRGISVISFLHMIAMEKKTCLFEVTRAGKDRGLLYFENGVLFDASIGKQTGENAALEIITDERAEMRFRDFPDTGINRRIHLPLEDLIERALIESAPDDGSFTFM